MKKLLLSLLLTCAVQAAPQPNPPLVRIVYIDHYIPWHPYMKYLWWYYVAIRP